MNFAIIFRFVKLITEFMCKKKETKGNNEYPSLCYSYVIVFLPHKQGQLYIYK